MSFEVAAYPFLLLALFLESFVLVTLLSKPARYARTRTATSTVAPRVAIIVPCYNEASTVALTCESLLALDYPKNKLEIILVNDGSHDGTARVMDQYGAHAQVRVIHKENGGKHTALNAGIAATTAELVGCLDADSFVEPGALREIVPCFSDPQVAAATAAMSVHKPKGLLQHMQNAEYTFGIALRHAYAAVNGIHVTPGPFSFYRRSALEELGGFRHGHQTEDMEMALRIQRAGYGIENAPRARVYTQAPSSISKLIKQRTRWITGFLRNVLGEYRDLIGSRRQGALGMLVLPAALLVTISSMVLFSMAIAAFTARMVAMLEIRAGIPFSYAFLPRTALGSVGSFDWFYLPLDSYLILVAVVMVASVSLIALGKRISRTPGPIMLGMVSSTFLYGLIAPIWLMRATLDVALGKRRSWR